MPSLQYQLSIPNYLQVRAADRLAHRLLESGRIPGLDSVDLPQRPLPGPEWLRLKPRLCGVCGSDLSLLLGKNSPALSPFASFPAVLGHEVVADVVETGADVSHVQPGDRVVVMPVISCEMRGLPPCPACQRGEPGLCTNSAEGKLAPGMLIGFCHDLPGGWSTDMIAHRSQVYAVPSAISDETAVLIEPLSVALHAVLKGPPQAGSNVLIIGSGTIGLLVLAALKLLKNPANVTILARHPAQIRLAEALGADHVLNRVPAGVAAVQITGARSYKPILGPLTYAGGFDWVYDCVGSASSLQDSLRVAGPAGHVIMVGCAGQISRLDCTFVWSRELHVTGCYVYGREPSLEGSPHTFEVALRLLQEQPDFPLADIITHTFPLTNWREALGASVAHGKHNAIKIVFNCQAD